MKYEAEEKTWEKVIIGPYIGFYNPYRFLKSSFGDKYERFEVSFDENDIVKEITPHVEDLHDFFGTFVLPKNIIEKKFEEGGHRRKRIVINSRIVSTGRNYTFDGEDFIYNEVKQLTKDDLVNLTL